MQFLLPLHGDNGCTNSLPFWVYRFIPYLIVPKIILSVLSACLSAHGGVIVVPFKIGKYVILSTKSGKIFMSLP